VTGVPRYVIDASVGASWLFAEPGSQAALALLARSAAGAAALSAPDVFVAEVTNVIWKRARLLNEISDERAREALVFLAGALPNLISSRNLASQAIELAMALRLPVYDCLYAALALREGATLVSADRQLVRTLGPVTDRVVHIQALQLDV
jgi:predicted nucleic acid-binding protein